MRRRRRPAGARVTSLTGLSMRSLLARPLRSLLSTGAIVLGVGMVFGVLLLVGTIHGTFDRLFDSIYGNTNVVVSGEQSVGSLPPNTIARVRAVDGVETAAGEVFSVFRTVGADGRVSPAQQDQLYVVGVDYGLPDTTSSRQVAGRNPIAGRGEIELPADWASERGIAVGDRIRLATPVGVAPLRVSGLFAFEGGLDLGGYGTASLPLADGRRLMDKPAAWDEIDVVAERGVSPAVLRDRLDAALGRGVEVATPQSKSDEVQDQLASLDVILYFFSGIALFVGGFLILNSFSMTVLQRMREIGTLRALGASDARVARGILTEAAVLGVIGSLLGLLLGVGLALLLVRAMRSFGMPVSSLDYSAGAALAALATGIVATLAGAAWPALRAARIPPIRALVGGSAPRSVTSRRRALAGAALFVPGLIGGGIFWFGSGADSDLAGIGGVLSTMVLLLGMVWLAPFIVLPLVRAVGAPLRRMMPAEGRLATDAARSAPGRTAATAATLLVALSVVVVNATVASSFVGSVKRELDARLSRDLTVQPLGYVEFGPPQAGLPAALKQRIAALPETGAVASRRVIPLQELPGGGQEGIAVAYDPRAYRQVDPLDYEGAPVEQVLTGLDVGGVVLGKAYAKARGLSVGDRVRLDGAAGSRSAPVVGIVDTFDMGGQTIQMSLATMAEVYGVRSDAQLIVRAAAPGERAALTRRVETLLQRDFPGAEALSNAELKERATAAIDQQFGFFNAIVGIAVLVGVLGIVNTLSMSVLERTREIGVLRALGASRWRIRRMMTDESLLIAVAGSLAGIAAGLLIALVWVVGMSRTSFPGMTLHLPLPMLIAIALLSVVVGVLAAFLPARRAARLDPLAALRYE